MLRHTAALVVLVPALAAAQSMPATHAYSGLDATSARHRLERGVTRPYGPKFEAATMPIASATEHFPGLRLPGQKGDFQRPAPVIRVVKPAFRLPEKDLGIADSQDVMFFAEARVVRFRIHLKAAGEPLAKRWTGQLRAYFDFLDRDGDGELNRHEAEFAFANAGVVQMIQSGFAYQRPTDAAKLFADLDVDADGKVRFDEFAAFYAPSAGRVITAQANPIRDLYSDVLTDELFQMLDTDKDKRLSRSELLGVERLFATLDADEDENLTALEVVPNLFNRPRPTTPVDTTAKPTTPSTPATSPTNPMTAFKTGSAPEAITQIILGRYDKDKNLVISRAENPLGPDAFQQLDKDGNGELAATELAGWANLPPDVDLDMILGGKPEESSIKTRPRIDGKPVEGFRIGPNGTAVFTIGNQAVQIACNALRALPGQPVRFGVLQFPDNGRGFVTEGDLSGPQLQLMRVLFDLIDRDADGKMSRAEFDAFSNLQRSFTGLPLSLVYSAQTPSLFQVLDANGDGRLSIREVRSGWDRLIALEPVEKEYVTRSALTPQGAVRFGRLTDVLSNPTAMYSQPPARQSNRGPAWFRKFDRNADGELSRSEFPGRAADFDRIDANHDGFITVEEAEAFDKATRVAK